MSAACIWAIIGEAERLVIWRSIRRAANAIVEKKDVWMGCSALRLADMEDGILENFFVHLEEGSEEHKKVWEEYMENLALL